ncbi:MAG: methylenetetrahydrofolate reductase, partial [Candidatus Hodgkinia cicadicola]
ISKLVSVALVRYLPMWSLMYHTISTEIASKELTSVLVLSGDRYIPIQFRTDYKYKPARLIFKNFSLYPDVHPIASGNIHEALVLAHRVSLGGSCIITQFCYDADNWARIAYQSAIFGNTKLIAGVFAPSCGRFGIRMALKNGIYIPYWLKQMLKAPTRRNSLIGLLSFLGSLIVQDVRFFHFYTLNKPRMMCEALWVLSAIKPKYGIAG